MKKTDILEIEFKQNLKNFIPEISARMIFLILSIFVLNSSVTNDEDQSYFYALVFIVFNIILLMLTLYGTKRRRISITNFINMRLRVHESYSASKIQYSSDFLKTPFYVLVVFSSILFASSIFVVLQNLNIDNYNANSYIYVITAIPVPFIYGLIIHIYRMNFISKGIVSVKFNDRLYTNEEITAFMSLLYDEKNESEAYYLNDGLIYEIEQKANIFKQRVETLLIEAVFIGALTFGTFIQLTSPESISSFQEIDEKEMAINGGLDFQSLNRESHSSDLKYLMSVLNRVDKSRQIAIQKKKQKKRKAIQFKTPFRQKKQNLNSVISTKIPYKLNFEKTVDSLSNAKSSSYLTNGIFQNWSIQRQYTIFSPLYLFFNSAPSEKREIYEIIDLGIHPGVVVKSDDLCLEIDSLKRNIIAFRDSLHKSNKDTNYCNLKAICSNSAKNLIKVRDQLELIKLSKGRNPYQLSENKRTKIYVILHKHSRDKFLKYYCVLKDSWDEQEYLFLIAVGSIICSVLYISVLIKRFAIIMKIESLFAELNKAMAWNRREEDALSNEMRTEVEGNNPIILSKFKEKREYYSEKLQIQLAKCELIGTKIETNIQVASFVRNIGLYTFFVILLIGTMMIDPKFTFILSSILIYAMLGSAFMQEGSNIRVLWDLISNSPKEKDEEFF